MATYFACHFFGKKEGKNVGKFTGKNLRKNTGRFTGKNVGIFTGKKKINPSRVYLWFYSEISIKK